jgi:hypothetical protein
MDTRIGLGPKTALANGSLTAISLAGYVPDGTVAVSGNVTITGQTSGGFVAMAPSLTLPAKISTINFPKADNRANGIVVPVDGSCGLMVVFSGASHATTHALFDLTGYFMPIP